MKKVVKQNKMNMERKQENIKKTQQVLIKALWKLEEKGERT